MGAGDCYLKRPCEGWSVVYVLHSIISVTALSSEAVLKLRNRVRADSPLAS